MSRKVLDRKYITEYALGYRNNFWSVLTANQLMSGWSLDDEAQAEVDKCHIYIITSRPSPYFVEGSVKHENDELSGELGYRINGIEHRMPFSGHKLELCDGAIQVKVDAYPHRDVWTYDADGNKVRYMSATFLASMYCSKSEVDDLNSFEVLYVGQALGKGNRSAQDRLLSHQTLQKILARTQHDHPDKEINIFMFQFEDERVFSSMDGTAVGADMSEKNEDRLMNVIKNPPDKKQKISMIEAGLIRYFQPSYNEIFKIKFPSTKIKTLQSCKKLDVSGLVVELDTSEHNFYFYSPTVRRKVLHAASYDLFTPQNRSSFFNVAGLPVLPGVIQAES